jgi:uncharacterized protein (UPF0332 family)
MTPDEYVAKARRSQESAHLLINAGDLVGAVNRAYYAMFYAAHASLTHAGYRGAVRQARHFGIEVRSALGKAWPSAGSVWSLAQPSARTALDRRLR